MLKKYPVFKLAYALVFIFVLAAEYWHWSKLNFAVKPCISLVLLMFLCLSTKLKGRFHQRLFSGLVFALTGDTLLMLMDYNPSWFLYGLIAFLICHIFYISAFYLDFLSAKELDKKGARIGIAACALVFTSFYLYLRPHLPLLKLPVLVSIFIGALLVMMSIFRNQRVNQLSFRLVFAGVLCFILTDGLMAQVHFVMPFAHADMLISAAYMIAQGLIIAGGVERKLLHTQTPL
ncbi:MAG: lysoplasmalogenase [Pedobacter sp.]|uniref:lysoplasmalogenase n=1 Tax=Pedobacter sp. TaxID=1411316 RepID=UPI00339AA00F